MLTRVRFRWRLAWAKVRSSAERQRRAYSRSVSPANVSRRISGTPRKTEVSCPPLTPSREPALILGWRTPLLSAKTQARVSRKPTQRTFRYHFKVSNMRDCAVQRTGHPDSSVQSRHHLHPQHVIDAAAVFAGKLI